MLSSSSFYNHFAQEYKQYYLLGDIQEHLTQEIAFVKQYSPTSILELGVGTGRFAEAYLKENPYVIYTGIDNASEMLFHNTVKNLTLHCTCALNYLQECTLLGKTFDCVIAPYTMLHHLAHNEQRELVSLLKQVTKISIFNCLSIEQEAQQFLTKETSVITLCLSREVQATMIYTIAPQVRQSCTEHDAGGGRVYLTLHSE